MLCSFTRAVVHGEVVGQVECDGLHQQLHSTKLKIEKDNALEVEVLKT